MPAQITSIAKAVKAAPEFLERYGLDRAITGRNVLGRGQFAVVIGPPEHPEIAVKFTVDEDDAVIAQKVLEEQEERGAPIPGIVEILEVVRFANDVRGKALNQRIARAVGKEHLTEYTDATLYAVVMERVAVENTMPPERRWSRVLVHFDLWVLDFGEEPPVMDVPSSPLSADDQRLMDHLTDGYLALAEMGYELGDIRSANIGWSSRRQQFVLFDFGVYHFTGSREHDPDALPLARNAWEVTSDQATERGIRAMVLAMTPRIELGDGEDFARNAAGPLLDLPDGETVYTVLVEALRGRRRNWPRTVWGSLSDTEINDLAAVAADAWTSSGALTPNRRSALPRTKKSFDRHFDEAANRFHDLGTIELHHDDAAGGDNGHGSERQFGFCEDGKPIRISFASKIEALPQKNIDGLVAHEFGHALDFRYGKRELERLLGIRLPDGAERRADAIAGAVFGRTIRYDQALVQCVSCKGQSPRPRRLGP